MEFKDLSDWIVIDGYCATRIIKGGNENNVNDRVAFIEKTPRVRIKNGLNYNVARISIDVDEDDCTGATNPERFIGKRSIWIYGDKGSEYGMDEDSRQWCDNLLKAMGWK